MSEGQLENSSDPTSKKSCDQPRGLGGAPKAEESALIQSASTFEACHAEFANFHEGYVRHYIVLADTKATVALGLSLGFTTFLLSQPHLQDLMRSEGWSVGRIQILIALLFLLLSSLCAVLVIVPRVGPNLRGLVYFGGVASHGTAKAYVDYVAKQTSNELTENRLRHCFDVSVVCRRKYAMLYRCIWFGFVGAVGALPLLFR